MRRRLTRYLAYVQDLCAREIEWVSSQELAHGLGLTSSTVRQDMSHVDFSGISKRGYETSGLEEVLKSVLGCDRAWRVVVVGAGNLGMALARHVEFERRGFIIEALFDSDPKKVGRKAGSLAVRAEHELIDFVHREHIDVGVIAVPASAAQTVADKLICAGVKGLLNLALVHLVAPKKVAVVDSRIVANLMELTHLITFPG